MPHNVIKGAILLRLNIACIVCQATTIDDAAQNCMEHELK